MIAGTLYSVRLYHGPQCGSQCLPFSLVANEREIFPFWRAHDDLRPSFEGVLPPHATMAEGAFANYFPIEEPVVLNPPSVGYPEPVETLVDRALLSGLRVGVGIEDPEAVLLTCELDGSAD